VPYAINAYAVQGSTNVFPADGNAGVGTTSPSAPLEVHFYNANSSAPSIAIDNNDPGGQNAIDFLNNGLAGARIRYANGGGLHVGTLRGIPMIFETGGITRMTVSETGDVLIGASGSAVEKLEVDGAIKLGITGGSNAGTVRWTGVDFEGYDGSTWKSLTGAGGGTLPVGSASQTLRHDGVDWVATDVLTIVPTGNVNVGSSTQDGELNVYRNGITTPVVNMTGGAEGGAVALFNESGFTTVEMGPDANGEGGRFNVRRTGTSTGFFVEGNDNGNGDPTGGWVGASRSAQFRMLSPGNNSVAFPVDAISSTEMLDEPGVASVASAGTVNLSGGVETAAVRTITTPAAGYVLVIGTLQAQIVHTGGLTSSGDFGVSDNATAFPANQDVHLEIAPGTPGGTYHFPITVHGLFETPTAGAHSFYLLAREASGSINATNTQLTVMFLPTAYGTVTPTLVGAGGDSHRGASAMSPSDLAAERAEAAGFHRERVDRELAAMRAELEALKLELGERD